MNEVDQNIVIVLWYFAVTIIKCCRSYDFLLV